MAKQNWWMWVAIIVAVIVVAFIISSQRKPSLSPIPIGGEAGIVGGKAKPIYGCGPGVRAGPVTPRGSASEIVLLGESGSENMPITKERCRALTDEAINNNDDRIWGVASRVDLKASASCGQDVGTKVQQLLSEFTCISKSSTSCPSGCSAKSTSSSCIKDSNSPSFKGVLEGTLLESVPDGSSGQCGVMVSVSYTGGQVSAGCWGTGSGCNPSSST